MPHPTRAASGYLHELFVFRRDKECACFQYGDSVIVPPGSRTRHNGCTRSSLSQTKADNDTFTALSNNGSLGRGNSYKMYSSCYKDLTLHLTSLIRKIIGRRFILSTHEILIFKKGKFFPVRTMKSYRGIRGMAPLILNVGTRLRCVVNFTLWLLHSSKETVATGKVKSGLQKESIRFGETNINTKCN